MTVAVPVDMPVTIPVDPTVMTASDVLHVPPPLASFKLQLPPTQIGEFPVIGRIVFTVTTTIAEHPVAPVE